VPHIFALANSFNPKPILRSVTKQSIYDIAWSPDGKYIIAGSTDNLAQIFNVADGEAFRNLRTL
jgi:chromatin assembly factor 1 subunit B